MSPLRRTLICHPASPCAAVRRIAVEARRRGGRLVLRYTVSGRIDDVRLPPPAAPARADALWRHTCFEAFVRPSSGPAYYELNFAPSMQWAAYQFDAYRSGMRGATAIEAPQIEAGAAAGRDSLQAALALPAAGAAWRLGLAAVIEEAGGGISYWALAHPPGRPDFHHADGFALELA
jgi:hypothetical protein